MEYCKDCTDNNPDVCNSHLDAADESYVCNCKCHDCTDLFCHALARLIKNNRNTLEELVVEFELTPEEIASVKDFLSHETTGSNQAK